MRNFTLLNFPQFQPSHAQMILNREEFTTALLVLTGLILLLACCVALGACFWAQFRCRRRRDRSNSKPGQPTNSSSYNPLLQSSKSDPISLDIEYIDSVDPNEQPTLVSSATQVKTLHGGARP